MYHLSDNRLSVIDDKMGMGVFGFEVIEIIGDCILCDIHSIRTLPNRIEDMVLIQLH